MLLGDAIADRFVIEAEAGRGGTGTVYRAWDRVDAVHVALKLLHAHGPVDARRFAREASLLAGLSHPNIVRYVAHGVTAEGLPYLAMEWVEGETLAVRLERRRLTLIDSLTVGSQAAEAVARAHAKGVVHRDLKPGNLLLPQGDFTRVKVVDFGVARPTGDVQRLTMTGALVGTPRYMSPEQARGMRDVDARSDVFSLGCMIFECVAGKPAFEGDDIMGVLAKILLEDAPRLRDLDPELPEPLDELLARMLAREPDARPKDAGVVAAELKELQRAVWSGTPLRLRTAERAGPTTTLTASEKRVICVVLAQGTVPADTDVTAPTVRSGAAAEPALRDLARPFGGVVERLADGSVTVVLSGAQTATDQAAMAARCALALRGALPEAPMAIGTGRGILAGARLPVGEVIDRAVSALRGLRAARAGAAAGPGPIRLDDVTAGLLDARFEVSGDAHGLTLVGERAVETTRTLLGKPTTCVGRERELELLAATFDEVVSEPVARAVLVTAPPGGGKSRVRYEFLRRSKQIAPRAEVLFGRGESLGAGAPFGMLTPAVRRLCRIVDGEPLDVSQRRLRARVGRHLPARDVQRVSEFLGEMTGVPFPDADREPLRAARRDSTLMGDAMRAAWEDWLRAECREQPLLLVLEDLHWGDLPSVKFVDHALRNLADRPLMVLAVARPDIHQQFPDLWNGRDLQEIRLGPLGRKAAEKLAREVLGESSPDATIDRVVTLADGNAFYLEELIRAVAGGAPSCDALPDTVLAMVQARLDALGDEAKRVLRAGSVFGDRFWRGGVTALVGNKTGNVQECLDDLCAREVVTRRQSATFPGELEYVFRNSLVREAAYAMLTDSDRALGHRLAGAWLERAARGGETTMVPGEEPKARELVARKSASGVDATALAEHFELGREPARALAWYRRGAEQALEANDFARAIATVERAVVAGAQDEALGALRLIQAEAHFWRGELEPAVARGEVALALLPRGGALWFRASTVIVDGAAMQGDLARARAFGREASAATPLPGAAGEQVVCICSAALRMTWSGRFRQAEDLFVLIDRVAHDPLPRHALARVHVVSALRAYYEGNPAGNLVWLELALAVFQELADARKICQLSAWLGFAHVELGDYPRAEELSRQSLAQAEKLGSDILTAAALLVLGLALTRRGELREARAVLERSLALHTSQGNRRNLGATHSYLSIAAWIAGDFALAEAEAREAVALLDVAPPKRAGAMAVLSRALLAQGRAGEALDAAREAMEQLGGLGSIDEGETLIRLMYAESLSAAGNRHAARAAILAARARLFERANRITDDHWRDSFLENIPDNARTLELAHAWSKGSANLA